jgi:hypothetical protein
LDKGVPSPFYGPKAIVVLTDGMDNSSYDKDSKANTRSVQKWLKKANEDYPDVDVVIVCFIDPDDVEFPVAKEQFEYVKNFTPKSGFFPQAKGGELGRTIEDILRPRVQLKLGDKTAPGFAGGRPVNFHSDSTLNWEPPIPADNYQGSILRTVSKKIDVKMPRGHDIFAVLKRSAGRLYLERGILAHQQEVIDVAGDNRKEEAGWLATLLENHVSFQVRDLNQLICFEKAKLEDPPELKQSHPGFVWMELADNKGQKPVVWGKEWSTSTPAAAYRLKVRGWPNEKPKVAAWFWPDIRDNFLDTDKLKLKFRDNENVSDSALVQRATELPIESVIWEEQKEIDLPSGEKQRKDCIVVRFRYPKGQPIFVDMIKDRLGPEVGAAHMYYLDAGKGTACFFGHARPTTVKLVLIDIEEFKKAAKSVEFTPRSNDIKAPAIFVREIRD